MLARSVIFLALLAALALVDARKYSYKSPIPDDINLATVRFGSIEEAQKGNRGKAESVDDEENRGQAESVDDEENRGQAESVDDEENRGQAESVDDEENRGQAESVEDEENRGQAESVDDEENKAKSAEEIFVEIMENALPEFPKYSLCTMGRVQVCTGKRERFTCIREACLNGDLVEGTDWPLDWATCLHVQYCDYLETVGPFTCSASGKFTGVDGPEPELDHLCHWNLPLLGCSGFDQKSFTTGRCRGNSCLCDGGMNCMFSAPQYKPSEWDKNCEYTGGRRTLRG